MKGCRRFQRNAARAAIAAALLLTVPAQAWAAAICLNIAGFGSAYIEIAGSGGTFVNLVGEMDRTDCPAASGMDRTVLTGGAHLTAAGQVHIGLHATGSPVCYPITVWGYLDLPALSGNGWIDVPSLGFFTDGAISQVSCVAPDGAQSVPSERRLTKPGT